MIDVASRILFTTLFTTKTIHSCLWTPSINQQQQTKVSARKCEIVFDYFLEERCIQEKIEHGKRDHAALEE